MPSLLDQLRDLQRRVRRLTWLTGLCWSASTLVGGLLLLGIVDWWWHLDDPGVRAFLLAALLASVGWLAWRRLVAPLRHPISNLDLTARLELHFPQLRSRLAAATEFLERGVSPQVGSPELQRRLIDETAAEVRSLDLTSVIDRREAQRVTWLLASVTTLAFLLAVGNSAAAGTAMRRWLWPLGNVAWPKSVELQFVRGDLSPIARTSTESLKCLQGQPLDLFVVNTRGALPQPVLAEFWQAGRAFPAMPLRTMTLRDSAQQPHEAAAVRLPIDEGELLLRAVGGDDRDMPWLRLAIVPPPKLDLFRVQVVPPKYTGESAVVAPEGATQIRALLGSRLLFTARATRALASARWEAGPIKVSASGQELSAEWLVTKVGRSTLRLALTDRDQFENPVALRLEIVGVADPPPVVSLLEPATDQLVTPNATLRLLATVKDDRGLRDVTLEHAQQSPTDEAPESWSIEPWPLDVPGREATLRRDWSLSSLPLSVGDRLALRIAAADHCQIGEPRVGRSPTRTLTVVSPETKLAEIAQRLDLLLHDLEALATRQSQTKDQTAALRVQVEKARELRSEDRDALKRVELDQRQIAARLTARGEGVIARSRELLEQFEINQLQGSPTRERLTRIALAVEDLSRQTLPSLESALGRIAKDAAATPINAELEPVFAEVGDRQGEVLTVLTDLIRDLTQWRDRRELAREMAELAQVQGTLQHETGELAPQTLGKSASQLSNQQQADLAKLADRQARQAERLEQLRQRLLQSSESPNENSSAADDSSATQTAREVVEELDRRAVIATAREAAQEVVTNNLGQATRLQRQLTENLQALAETLAQQPTSNADSTLRELRELAGQIDALAQQERDVLEQTRATAVKAETLTPEELAEQTQTLRERQKGITRSAEELASRLKSADAAESRGALRRAGRHMQQAEAQLAEQRAADAADEEQAALDDLEQSRRELAAAHRAIQQQQLADQARELAEAVRDMITRQQTVIDETQQLSAEQARAGKWTRPLSKAVLNLGDAEQALADGTGELADSLTDLAPLRLTLSRASEDLAAAAARLRAKQLDDETRRREQSALQLLKLLDHALSPPPPGTPSDPTPPPDNVRPDPSPEEPVPPVAQLRLLRQLQADLGDRTHAAHTRRTTPADDSLRQSEVKKLAEDQKSLHDATADLLDRVPAMPADNDAKPTIDESASREATLEAMQKSVERLNQQETGTPTQTAQQAAIAALDTLLKSWQQRAGKSSSVSRSGQPAPESDHSPNQAPTTADGTGGKPSGRDSARPRDSSDRDHTGVDVEAELRRQRQLREAVWGHLPPTLREKMLNLPHDKTLPKYSEHIRRYYEALADED